MISVSDFGAQLLAPHADGWCDVVRCADGTHGTMPTDHLRPLSATELAALDAEVSNGTCQSPKDLAS